MGISAQQHRPSRLGSALRSTPFPALGLRPRSGTGVKFYDDLDGIINKIVWPMLPCASYSKCLYLWESLND